MGCVEILQDGLDNMPQDEAEVANADHQIGAEELKLPTVDRFIAGPDVDDDHGPVLGDFILELRKNFSAVRYRRYQEAV